MKCFVAQVRRDLRFMGADNEVCMICSRRLPDSACAFHLISVFIVLDERSSERPSCCQLVRCFFVFMMITLNTYDVAIIFLAIITYGILRRYSWLRSGGTGCETSWVSRVRGSSLTLSLVGPFAGQSRLQLQSRDATFRQMRSFSADITLTCRSCVCFREQKLLVRLAANQQGDKSRLTRLD